MYLNLSYEISTVNNTGSCSKCSIWSKTKVIVITRNWPKKSLNLKNLIRWYTLLPTSIYLFKPNDGNTRTMCEIYPKSKVRHQNDFIDVIPVFLMCTLNKLHILLRYFFVDFEQINIGWAGSYLSSNRFALV